MRNDNDDDQVEDNDDPRPYFHLDPPDSIEPDPVPIIIKFPGPPRVSWWGRGVPKKEPDRF